MIIRPFAAISFAFAISACVPVVPPSQVPDPLKEMVANAIIAHDGGETCSGVRVNESLIERDFEDLNAKMIEAGYTFDQIDAMFAGLESSSDWLYPYAVNFARRNNIELSDDSDENFCVAISRERQRSNYAGRYLN